MDTTIKNVMAEEISDEMLENVSGGTSTIEETVKIARCPECGREAVDCGQEKVKGAMGLVTIYKCANKSCSLFDLPQYGCDMNWSA